MVNDKDNKEVQVMHVDRVHLSNAVMPLMQHVCSENLPNILSKTKK